MYFGRVDILYILTENFVVNNEKYFLKLIYVVFCVLML